jgi:hypothetical protein
MSSVRLFPLDVVVVGEHGHAGTVRHVLLRYLANAKAVRNFGLVHHLESGSRLAFAAKVNTIIVSPHHVSTAADVKKNAQFILRVRKERPDIVFILNVDSEFYEKLCKYNKRFEHYFRVDRDSVSAAQYDEYDGKNERRKNLHATLDNLLFRCQEWHFGLHKYDVAISFAGKDRKVARSLARHLIKLGSRVFFDEFEKSAILGGKSFIPIYAMFIQRRRGTVVY